MTDFQACADDHVDSSSSVTSFCYICRIAVSFIERFVTEVPISTQQSIRLYLCKPCFSRLDKARRAAEEAEKLSTRLESRFVVVHLLQSNL